MAKIQPEVHLGWIDYKVPSSMITEVWAGAQEVIGELWMNGTIMTDSDTLKDKEHQESHPISIFKKTLRFTEEGRLLKSDKDSRRKEKESAQVYFLPRSNIIQKINAECFETWSLKHTFCSLYVSPSNRSTNPVGPKP